VQPLEASIITFVLFLLLDLIDSCVLRTPRARSRKYLLPQGLDSLFFANSGAEAVENAVKIARAATGMAVATFLSFFLFFPFYFFATFSL